MFLYSGRFALDETAAIQWLTAVTERSARMADNGRTAYIPLEWDPLEMGEESAISSLIFHAIRAEVLVCPPEKDVEFEFTPDEDGGHYRVLVKIAPDVTLAYYAMPMRSLLNGASVTGMAAADAVLRRVVQQANYTLVGMQHFLERERLPWWRRIGGWFR